jgi:hypothetical protein
LALRDEPAQEGVPGRGVPLGHSVEHHDGLVEVAGLGKAGDHGVPRHDVSRGHPVEHGARGGDVPRTEERGEARVGRDEEGVSVARRRLVEQVARLVVRWGEEAGVEVSERGVRVRVRVEGGGGGELRVRGEAGHGLEHGGEGEGAGAVVGRAEGGEVERDGAAGPTLVRRSADGERPRRVEAGGGRGAHRRLPSPSRARTKFGETETATTFLRLLFPAN